MADMSAEALAFLDEVAAPLTMRQIEHALREYGMSKSRRSEVAPALHRLNIIAITPKENDND